MKKDKIKHYSYIFIISVFTLSLLMNACLASLNFTTKNSVVHAHETATEVFANTKTIDLTGLTSGSDVSHIHIYEKKYDDKNHWEECFICNKKRNIIKHTIEEIWENNEPHCSAVNGVMVKCTDNCGYSKPGVKPPHPSLNKPKHSWEDWIHTETCTADGHFITRIHCTKADGSRITCKNLGVCVVCGFDYTKSQRHWVRPINGKLQCSVCDEVLGTYNRTISFSTDHKKVYYTIHVTTNRKDVNFSNDMAKFYTYSAYSNGKGIDKAEIDILSFSAKDMTVRYTGTMTDNTSHSVYLNGRFYFSVAGQDDALFFDEYTNVLRDINAPTITNVTVKGNGTANKFSTNAVASVTSTDELSTNVYMRLLDSDNKTVIKDWSLAKKTTNTAKNNTFTYDFDITAETKGTKNLYVEAKDNLTNTSSKKFQVSYLDSKAPTLNAFDFIDGNNNEWGKNKIVDVSSIDAGAGGVQIGFNNPDEYSLATVSPTNNTLFIKNYTFVGDVYNPNGVTAALYMKDSAGNQRMSKVNVKKLDNTAPTITKVTHALDKKYPKATVQVTNANDINTTLNASGSGITGYAISKEKVKDTNKLIFQTSSSFVVDENATYYIYAKDLVGNISNPFTYKVDNIVFGNISFTINKEIRSSDNPNQKLSNPQIKNDYGLNLENDAFKIKLINCDTGEEIVKRVYNQRSVEFSNLDIGKYELIEDSHKYKNLTFDSFTSGINEENEFKKENGHYYLYINKRYIYDTNLSSISKSNFKLNEIVVSPGESNFKDNLFIKNK